jgi:hypothetical protein
MSFIGILKQDATDVETAVVGGLKTALDYVDNFTVTELIPALETQLLAAIEKLGQEALALLLGNTTVPIQSAAPAVTSTPEA